MLHDDTKAIREAIFDLGYGHPDDPQPMVDNAIDIMKLVCEPFAHRGTYDFAASGLISRARNRGIEAAFGHGLRGFGANVVDHHICTLLRKGQRISATQAAACTSAPSE